MNIFTKVFIGDIRKAYKYIPDNYIDCVITSPPYFQQRDYGVENQIGLENTAEEYAKTIAYVFKLLYHKIKKTGTIFLNIGYKYLKEEFILIPELVALEMNRNGYILKNKIIWYKPNAMPTPSRNRLNNTYESILFFVKKEGKEVFYFNLDNFNNALNFNSFKLSEDFIGALVEDNLTYRDKRKGKVIAISRNNKILVEWENGTFEAFEVMDYFEDVNFICPECKELLNYWDIILAYANYNNYECKNCKSKNLPLPKIIPSYEVSEESWIMLNEVNIKTQIIGKHVSNKYKKAQIITSSPAGRLAITGEKFIIKRKYKIPQPLIADYLKQNFKKLNISPKEIDKKLGYNHTASHWIRKDFNYWGKGGSLPRPSDWIKLKEILKLDNIYDELMTRTIAIFSTVRNHPKGKNIGDVWEIPTEPSSDEHFAIFPEKLVENCLKLGCPPGGICLDPFAGTGTVGKVSRKFNISSILVEINPQYLKIIKRKCPDAEFTIQLKSHFKFKN